MSEFAKDRPQPNDLPTVVKTLRFLAGGWVEPDDAEWMAGVADRIEHLDLDGCCPLCQEVECDKGCPLEYHRWDQVIRPE